MLIEVERGTWISADNVASELVQRIASDANGAKGVADD